MVSESIKSKTQIRAEGAAIRRLAPEDLAPGLYVSVMRARVSRPWWIEDEAWKGESTRVVEPSYTGLPLRVVGVCLPFVLVEKPDGRHWTLDVRRHELARFSTRYGSEAFKRYARDVAKGAESDEDD